MKPFLKIVILAAAAAACAAIASSTAVACPSCYGQAQGPVIDGVNRAILAMIGITGFVLGGVGAMFVSIARRAKRINAARESAAHIETGA